jgi:hypothetical protein
MLPYALARRSLSAWAGSAPPTLQVREMKRRSAAPSSEHGDDPIVIP